MQIKMTVFKRSGRQHYECQWKDPITGRKLTRSTGKKLRRDAERFAGKLASDLEQGAVIDPNRVTWAETRREYEEKVLRPKARKTQEKSLATLRAVERIISPRLLLSIDARAISRYATAIRDEGRAEYTVKGHLAELRKLLRWAGRQGYLTRMPAIEMPTPHGMKGRAITEDEFKSMLDVTAAVVGKDSAESWQFLQRGLWLSGLRLAESMVLRWDDDRDLRIDLSGRRPLIRIQAHAEKGRKHRVLPITPDFVELLQSVPKRERTGFVFNPRPLTKPFDVRLSAHWTSKVIARIGAKADIKVSQKPPKAGDEPTVIFASAHDFRRAFGFRWAQRVMPVVLQEMMRHESITTTMQYYVGRQAEAAADTLWQAVANTSANDVQPSQEIGA